MKLFISYRRKSWPFARQLADRLSQQLDCDIFIDYDDVDEADFSASLMRNLRESSAVLLIVSEHTFEGRIWHERDWLRREIREALRLRLPIILACVDGLYPPKELPPDIAEISHMEGVRFFVEYFEAGVDRLAAFIVRSTPIPRRSGRKSKPVVPALKRAPPRLELPLSERPTLLKRTRDANGALGTLPHYRVRTLSRPALLSLAVGGVLVVFGRSPF